MNIKNISYFITALLLVVQITGAEAQNALNILNKMDEVMYGPKDITSRNTIILIDKNGNEKERTARIIQKGNDMRLMRFTAPASQQGIAVLSLPNDVMYLYLPAFGKERRISTSVKNQKFAGTDFSYDDMESKPYVEKYNAKLIASKENSFQLELKPLGRSSYSKIMVMVNKDHYFPELMEYFDKRGKKLKIAKYDFEKIGQYWNAKRIEMNDLSKDHKTIMLMSDVKYDSGLSDDLFSIRNLKKG